MKKLEKEKLQLGKFIACGAFGAVYEGVYDGQKVAVKVLRISNNRQEEEEEEEVFIQEALVWSKLDHPNVAKFIGAAQLMLPDRESHGREKKLQWCMVSEFLQGGALNNYLCQRMKKGLPLKTVIRLALDAARGLAYMHSENVAHRDVKTDNMVLDSHGRVKLIDFGLSINAYEACEDADIHKYDVFNFGTCLREMLCTVLSGCTGKLADLVVQCGFHGQVRPEMAQVVQILEEISAEEEAKAQTGKWKKAFFKGCFGFWSNSEPARLTPTKKHKEQQQRARRSIEEAQKTVGTTTIDGLKIDRDRSRAVNGNMVNLGTLVILN